MLWRSLADRPTKVHVHAKPPRQRTPVRILFALVVSLTALSSQAADAQQEADSAQAPAKPKWGARYGGGPSVGAPPSDYTGATPPTNWCLNTTARATGDFGIAGWPWMRASKSWLHDALSDTSDHGDGWRMVLGGAPRLTEADSVVFIDDERTCEAVAHIIHRDVLGWRVGPPPVVVFRVRDYLVAYPSNARLGEFGFAVGMTLDHEIRGVAAW